MRATIVGLGNEAGLYGIHSLSLNKTYICIGK
jgi:hypothetical protein